MMNNSFECKSCGEVVEFTDTRYCFSHDKAYCVWCAGDRHGNWSELKNELYTENTGYKNIMWKENILKIEKIKNIEKSESALVELSKTQLIILNKEKIFKSSLMSKLIKTLKENPRINHFAYIQSEEIVNRAIIRILV